MGTGYEIARAIETLIASGHVAAEAWAMTPRQMAGWLQLAERRRLGEDARMISLMRASKAEPRAFRKLVEKLRDEST